MLWLLAYLSVGVFAGLIAGLLGVGGGIVNVPALSWIFTAQGYSESIYFHMALGTSLATILFTGTSAAYKHYCLGNVSLRFASRLAISGVLGSASASYLASLLTASQLKPAFGIMLIISGIQMFTSNKTHKGEQRDSWQVAIIIGFTSGMVSGFFGVGGGIAAVPLMLWVARFEPKRAVATSAVMVTVFGLVGGVSYMFTGWEAARDAQWTIGYVHIVALIFISLSSIFTARLGAQFADRINPLLLKRIFAVALILVGADFLSTLW